MNQGRILVVDDNPVNLKLAQMTLRLAGYEVGGATDVPEAMAATADFRPDLILMDIQLPGMDGLEVTRRLKSEPETSSTRIIALTAYAMKGDKARALAAGCDGYLTKP